MSLCSLAQAQATDNVNDCAWYDPLLITNFPKGCNSGSLGDVNDPSISYTSAGDSGDLNKPLSGSSNNQAKVSHNGSLNGVMDLNGTMWETNLGMTNSGTTATGTTLKTDNLTYILKRE